VKKQFWKTHPELPFIGCHIDGGIGYNDQTDTLAAIIEVKCPKPKNHYKNVKEAFQYHEEYIDQCQGNAAIWGAKEIHFVSFDDRFPEKSQLSIHKFPVDLEWQDVFLKRAKLFWDNYYLPEFEQMQKSFY
jgi:hypothetical protein